MTDSSPSGSSGSGRPEVNSTSAVGQQGPIPSAPLATRQVQAIEGRLANSLSDAFSRDMNAVLDRVNQLEEEKKAEKKKSDHLESLMNQMLLEQDRQKKAISKPYTRHVNSNPT